MFAMPEHDDNFQGEDEDQEQAMAQPEESPDAATADGQDLAADDLVRHLQAELDEAIEARKRALADFKNYQRRAADNEQRAATMARAQLTRSIMPALDHFDLALAHDASQMTLENLLQAVRIVRDEFSKALASQGVERIEPATGEAFDPHRHQAVKREASPGAAPNSIVAVYQPGYALGEMVLRPATVVVAGAAAGE